MLRIALAGNLSAYHAEYVALARNLGCRLATNDRRLAAAVRDVALLLSQAASQIKRS